jgi:hypothetical protein
MEAMSPAKSGKEICKLKPVKFNAPDLTPGVRLSFKNTI